MWDEVDAEPSAEKQYFAALEALRESKRLLAVLFECFVHWL